MTQEPYSGQELRLLRLLSQRYPTIQATHVEMINLQAILGLPKGTDHYISDIHGAYTQFDHILRHASGAIRRKIQQTFGAEVSEAEQAELEMLIYYPEKKLHSVTPLLARLYPFGEREKAGQHQLNLRYQKGQEGCYVYQAKL